MDRKDIVDYLTNLFTAAPVEPMHTAALLKKGYDAASGLKKAFPEFELISDAGGGPATAPAPAAALPQDVPPPQLPNPVGNSSVPAPVAKPAVPAPVAKAPVAAPRLPPLVAPQRDKYDDTARQQLYDALAAKRQDNAGWEAIGNISDLNSRMGSGSPTDTAGAIVAKDAARGKEAKGDFEAGRTAMVGEQDRQLAREDKRAALEATLASKRESDADRNETRRALAELAKSNRDLTLGTRNDQFRDSKTQSMRKEIMGAKPYQSYLTVHGMANSVRMAAKDPSAYGDLSSIYALVKGLDPTSVVREGEIGLMREVSGLKDRLVGNLEKWGGKGPITANQMQDINNVMERLEDIAAENVRAHAAPTLNQAKRMQIDENELLGDVKPRKSTAAPQANGDSAARQARIAQLRKELGK